MGYNGPGPEPVKMHLNWIRIRSPCLQRIYCPHREIADQQKSDHFSSWFASGLLWIQSMLILVKEIGFSI